MSVLHLLCCTKLTAIFVGTKSETSFSFFFILSRSSFSLASSVASMFLILALQQKQAKYNEGRKEISYLREREINVLFNDALNTFYLRLYGVRHMVKDHSDSAKGNPLPPHRLLLSINSKGSFICTIPQTG